jgi:hypothetical protein
LHGSLVCLYTVESPPDSFESGFSFRFRATADSPPLVRRLTGKALRTAAGFAARESAFRIVQNSKSEDAMKTKPLFHLLAATNLAMAALPLQAALSAPFPAVEPAKLIQLTSGGHALGFDAGGVYTATGTHALRVEFVNSNAVRPRANTPGVGSDGPAAPLNRVAYADLWDGIDLEFSIGAGGIYTTTYAIDPGASPAQIRLRYNAPLTLNADGTLSIAFNTGVMTESAPAAWQDVGGERVPVKVSFRIDGRDVGFVAGPYDPRYPLTIDPTLAWNTFLGGSSLQDGA